MDAQRRQRAFVCFTVAAGCFGLLLWARLLLVTGYPRTATADETRVFAPMHPPAAVLEKIAEAERAKQTAVPKAPEGGTEKAPMQIEEPGWTPETIPPQ